MGPWDRGSFGQDGDDEDLPAGWGDATPPGTPPPQELHKNSDDPLDDVGMGEVRAGVEAASTAPKSARRANNDTHLAMPWGAGVTRSTVRRELPSLFTNVPEQASASGVDPKGRPPRPPAPESRMPWAITDGSADHKPKRGRRASRERPELAAAAAAPEEPSVADGVREALKLLRQRKQWATAEETLDGLEALQRMQRHMVRETSSELPPLTSSRGGCRTERLRAASANVPRGGSITISRAESRSSSKSSVGSLPELPTRRAASAPLESRRAGLRGL